VRNRLRKGPGLIRTAGPDYLAHGILDTVIDAYYPILEQLGDDLERLEDRVMLRPSAKTLERLTAVRHMLLQLRRTLWPQREAVQHLLRDEHPMISSQSTGLFSRHARSLRPGHRGHGILPGARAEFDEHLSVDAGAKDQ
jgi:Mg2+ and Co2+ transporter CorA